MECVVLDRIFIKFSYNKFVKAHHKLYVLFTQQKKTGILEHSSRLMQRQFVLQSPCLLLLHPTPFPLPLQFNQQPITHYHTRLKQP